MIKPPVFAEPRSLFYLVQPHQEPRLTALLRRDAYPAGPFTTRLMIEHCCEVLGGGLRHDEFTAEVVSDDSARAQGLITAALSFDGRTRTLREALRGFFTATATELLCGPSAHFELAYGYRAEAPDEDPVAFRLCPTPSGSIGTRRGRQVQFVPKARAEHRTLRGVGYVDLSDTPLIHFHLDADLENDLKTAMGALASPDVLTAMAEADARTELPGRARGRGAGPSLTAATARIGWNGGASPFSNAQLTPYHTYRYLETVAFKIKIRTAILRGLNSALEQAGRQLHLPMRIELTDVTTIQQVRDAQDALHHGRRTLNELDRWALLEA